MAEETISAGSRLARLRDFLKADPDNLVLLTDAAHAAFDAGELGEAQDFLARYAQTGPLPPALQNLSGLVALSSRRFEDAAAIFADLRAQNPEDATLSFNLAWAKAMTGDFAQSATLLEGPAAEVSPAAARLLVQSLHHLGRLDEALATGEALRARFPNDAALAGALSSVAIDAEDVEAAAGYARAAGNQADGLATLGMLRLADDDVRGGMDYFERALALSADDARAELGKGLALMAEGRSKLALAHLDRAANLFRTHLGSWIAAGWAYFAAGDLTVARARFETALALDDTFSESHGALAVLDILAGESGSGRRRTDIALRLDRRCFSGALAQMLLLSGAGRQADAERVREIAMNAPIAPGGRTLAQALTGLAARGGR
jgi:tetratricopeptide (TPR) repeat protein